MNRQKLTRHSCVLHRHYLAGPRAASSYTHPGDSYTITYAIMKSSRIDNSGRSVRLRMSTSKSNTRPQPWTCRGRDLSPGVFPLRAQRVLGDLCRTSTCTQLLHTTAMASGGNWNATVKFQLLMEFDFVSAAQIFSAAPSQPTGIYAHTLACAVLIFSLALLLTGRRRRC